MSSITFQVLLDEGLILLEVLDQPRLVVEVPEEGFALFPEVLAVTFELDPPFCTASNLPRSRSACLRVPHLE